MAKNKEEVQTDQTKTEPQAQVLMTYQPSWGGDPELFIATKDGKIIGGEKVVPQGGLGDSQYDYRSGKSIENGGRKRVVLDGVQVEFVIQASTCRASLGGDIKLTFRKLQEHLKKAGNGAVPSFEAVVRVDPAELEALSEEAKKLGCAPSHNIHDRQAAVVVTKANENLRSAGGHIHLGLSGKVMEHRERLPFLLDVIVGNTCVLIDRNPLAAERRTMYGRAGEYRTPAHGLEYRTLSNFWLRSYQLMSFVMGLSKIATSVLYTTVAEPEYKTEFDYEDREKKTGYKAVRKAVIPEYNPADRYKREKWSVWDAEAALLSKVDMEKVVRAINTNDADLAWENWKVLKEFIQAHVPAQGINGTRSYAAISKAERGRADWILSLDAESVDAFEYFAKKVQEKGIEYWFPEDPITHWCNLGEGHGIGWEAFLLVDKVVPEMRKEGLWAPLTDEDMKKMEVPAAVRGW